jgi:mono/diheme cytochrome c family protein
MIRVLAAFALAGAALLAPVDQAPPAAAGAALFARSCGSCHDVEGRAPSLSTGVFTHGGDEAQLAQTIRAGVPGTQMPAFPQLSPEAISQLVTYIRSRAPTMTAAPAAAGAGGAGLTEERLRRSAAEPTTG